MEGRLAMSTLGMVALSLAAAAPTAAAQPASGADDEASSQARAALELAESRFGSDDMRTVTAMWTLARSLQAQGRFAEAEPLFRRALATVERTLGADHVEAMAPATQLANFYLAQNRFDLAEPLYRRVLMIAETRLGPAHEQTISVRNGLATVYAEQADHATAEAMLLRARADAEQALGADHPLTLKIVANVAAVRHAQGRYAEAAPDLVRVLEARGRTLGPEHPESLQTANELAILYVMQGRYDDAEPLLLRILEARTRTLGPDHPETLASVDDFGSLRTRQGRFAEAEPLHRRAYEGRAGALGPDHPDALVSASNLGRALLAQGRYDEAEPLFRRAAEQAARTLGEGHPTALSFLSNLAAVHDARGRLAEAEPLHRRVLEGRERTLGADHIETLQARNNLGMLYLQQGRYAEAEPLLLGAVEAADRGGWSERADTLLYLGNLAILYQRQARMPEAAALLERALAAAERGLGPDHPNTLLLAGNLGLIEVEAGRFAEAEALIRRALAGRERAFGRDHRDTLLAAGNLAMLYQRMGRTAEAEPLLRRVANDSARVLGAGHPDTASTRFNLAGLLTAAGRAVEAEPLFAAALETNRDLFGTDHPDTIAVSAMLAAVRMALPGRQADALDPARLFVAGSRARRAPAGETRFAEAQAGREIGLADGFLLFADAAWAQAGDPDAAATDEAFRALQDAAAGATDRAVASMAVRRLADRVAPGLGALVREREGLETRWSLANELYAEALAETGDAGERREPLRAERERIAARMDEIDAAVRRDFPRYWELVRPEALSTDAARALLGPDEAVLLVVPGFRGTHVVAVTQDGAGWTRSDWTRDRVDAAVQRLLWDVGANVAVDPAQAAQWERAGGSGYGYDRATAYALYRELVAPAAAALAGKRHVFVAAAGSLSSLPFGMLVTEPPEGADGDPAMLRATRWFADAHALIQLPSVQSLAFLRRHTRDRGEAGGAAFLGFGDPVLRGAAEQRSGGRGGTGPGAPVSVFADSSGRSGPPLADVRRLRLLSRLPGTAIELEAMRGALGAPENSLFLAGRATETALRGADLAGVRILALATHGLLAGELRGAAEPGLVFTPPETPSESDDGFLTASEVAALRLDADWVILSACNTAAGDGSQGAPGLSGLVRAFFYAGARNLLASHWPVRDDVAARLTVRTLEIARADASLSRAEAFQRAMREIRDDVSRDGPEDSWAHPNAWAPFTLIGDGAR